MSIDSKKIKRGQLIYWSSFVLIASIAISFIVVNAINPTYFHPNSENETTTTTTTTTTITTTTTTTTIDYSNYRFYMFEWAGHGTPTFNDNDFTCVLLTQRIISIDDNIVHFELEYRFTIKISATYKDLWTGNKLFRYASCYPGNYGLAWRDILTSATGSDFVLHIKDNSWSSSRLLNILSCSTISSTSVDLYGHNVVIECTAEIPPV